jgi:hypothetical protein
VDDGSMHTQASLPAASAGHESTVQRSVGTSTHGTLPLRSAATRRMMVHSSLWQAPMYKNWIQELDTVDGDGLE